MPGIGNINGGMARCAVHYGRLCARAARAGLVRGIGLLLLASPLLAGCGSLAFDNPLTATQNIKSAHASADNSYPAIGISPPPPATPLSEQERAKAMQELNAARASNKAAAGASTAAPLTR